MGGHPIGRQPFMTGQWSGYRGGGSINIYHKEVHNNYGGAIFPMNYGMYGNYGYYNPGLTAGEKWMLALGGIGAIGGGILGALSPQSEEVQTEQKETPKQDNSEFEATIKAQKAENEKLENEIKKLEAENKKMAKQMEDIIAAKKASQEYEAEKASYTIGTKEIKTQTTTPFTVNAKKEEDGTVTGHTGYNIIAGMYQTKDKQALTGTEIKAIAKEIFGNKALKAGEIQLPNEITVNGTTYFINPDGKDKVKEVKYELAKHEVYQSGAKQEGSQWKALLNGQELDGLYNTQQEAEEAAKAEGEKLKASKEE